MSKPYAETKSKSIIYRSFDTDVDNAELVWHRDKKTRLVEVIGGKGWYFQSDNKLPIELKVGDVFTIQKETYHRILKGKTPLKVMIKELD